VLVEVFGGIMEVKSTATDVFLAFAGVAGVTAMRMARVTDVITVVALIFIDLLMVMVGAFRGNPLEQPMPNGM
jgi:hypothetical protein